MKELRALILGETWTIPIGIAIVLLVGFLLRAVAPDAWEDVGGFILLAGVIAVLGVALRR